MACFLQSFPAKGPVIQLDNITEVKELEQDGPRFPFEVHHKGKHSPWELRVYSEVKKSIDLPYLPCFDTCNYCFASTNV